MTATVYLSYEIPSEDRTLLEAAIFSLVAVRKIKRQEAMYNDIVEIVNLAVTSSIAQIRHNDAEEAAEALADAR